MQDRSIALFTRARARDRRPRVARLGREACGDRAPLRPLSAPQRDPRPRVDAGRDRVPAGAGVELLARACSIATRRPLAAGATMRAAMNSVLGVFGGTFDPIHCGHLELARELRAALGLVRRSLHSGRRSAAPSGAGRHRRRTGSPWSSSRSRDIRASKSMRARSQRTGRSYTVTTLEELRDEDPARALALIVGADAFLGLPTWHRWREIFELAHVVVVARPGCRARRPRCRRSSRDEWSRRLCRRRVGACRASPPARSSCQQITAHPISASAIRECLGRAAPTASTPCADCFPPRFWPILNATNSTSPVQDAT